MRGKEEAFGAQQNQGGYQTRSRTGQGQGSSAKSDRETHLELDHIKSFRMGVITGLFSEEGPLTANERKRHVHEVHEKLPPSKVSKKESSPPSTSPKKTQRGSTFPTMTR